MMFANPNSPRHWFVLAVGATAPLIYGCASNTSESSNRDTASEASGTPGGGGGENVEISQAGSDGGTAPVSDPETGGAGAPANPPPEQCRLLDLNAGETGPAGLEILAAHKEFGFGFDGLGAGAHHIYYKIGTNHHTLHRIPFAGGDIADIEMGDGNHIRAVHEDKVFFAMAGDTEFVPLAVAAADDPMNAVVISERFPAPNSGLRNYAISSTHFYFEREGEIIEANFDGSGEVILTPSDERGMLVHQQKLWFMDNATEQLSSIALPSGSGDVERHVKFFFGGIMHAEGDQLAWVDDIENQISAWKIEDAIRQPVAKLDRLESPDAVMVKGDDIYWLPGGFGCSRLLSVPFSGGETTIVAAGFEGGSWLYSDDTFLYLIDENYIARMPLP